VIIIGLGSPFGDDQVGWRVAEALEEVCDGACARVLCLDRPGPALLNAIDGRTEVILVDGAATGCPPGTVHHLAVEDILTAPQVASSHGLGLAYALRLGRALGILPTRLTLFLVSIDPTRADQPGADLSPSVKAAVEPLAAQIRRRCTAATADT
jgi:hydrogenase maturation protease